MKRNKGGKSGQGGFGQTGYCLFRPQRVKWLYLGRISGDRDMHLMRRGTLDVTQGVIWKQLLAFFIPLWCGTFFQQLYNTVDTVVVGPLRGQDRPGGGGLHRHGGQPDCGNFQRPGQRRGGDHRPVLRRPPGQGRPPQRPYRHGDLCPGGGAVYGGGVFPDAPGAARHGHHSGGLPGQPSTCRSIFWA